MRFQQPRPKLVVATRASLQSCRRAAGVSWHCLAFYLESSHGLDRRSIGFVDAKTQNESVAMRPELVGCLR